MSWQAMQAMLKHSQAKGTARTVGAAIASYAHHETGLAFPSNALMTREWGIDARTIQRGLRELEDLGELRRRPELETYERRRVYLVDPLAGRQLSLLDADSASSASRAGSGQPPGSPGDTRARVEGTVGNLNGTPQTPQGGPASNLQPSGQPRADHRLQGAGGARRRRNRRRAKDACVASEPCPLNGESTVDRANLEEVWAEMDRRLSRKLGSQWVIWFDGAHLHDAAERLVIALDPSRLYWCERRYGRVIAAVCERPLRFVACAELAGTSAGRG